MITRSFAVASLLVASGYVFGQAEGQPEAAGPESARIQAISDVITGSWATAPKEGEEGGRSAIHVAPIRLEGGSSAFYVEFTNADAVNQVDKQEIWRLIETEDDMRLRVMGFRLPQFAHIRYSSLWIAPELLPEVMMAEAYPLFDMEVSGLEAGTCSASTAHTYPTSEAGATDIEASATFSKSTMTWHVTLLDAGGEVTWQDEEGQLVFNAYEPPTNVERHDNGLVVMDLVEGEGPAAENGDTVLMHYTGWNTQYQIFDTSRRPGREAYPVKLPGQVIQGWQEGLIGIKEGGLRRLYIPSALAYGASGRGPLIGPNETLQFEVECVKLTEGEASGAEGGAEAGGGAETGGGGGGR
jgi:FKBP-type peptidyl-prolyl cis-trans isomerase